MTILWPLVELRSLHDSGYVPYQIGLQQWKGKIPTERESGARYRQDHALREESSQTNVILQYKLLASILSAVCSVIQQS